MKKKAVFMLGVAGSLGLANCKLETRSSEPLVPVSGAGRVITSDSANDRVIVDTSSLAVTRNVRKHPNLQITGLFSRSLRPKKGDILFFTIDTNTATENRTLIETCTLFSYHMN